jgi:hypothetical protein
VATFWAYCLLAPRACWRKLRAGTGRNDELDGARAQQSLYETARQRTWQDVVSAKHGAFYLNVWGDDHEMLPGGGYHGDSLVREVPFRKSPILCH